MNVSFSNGILDFYNLDKSSVVISDGQKIKVAVLKNNGDGTSLVSFGGGKFNVRCLSSFEPGQVFEANVVESNGKILLQPEEGKTFAFSFIKFMEQNGLVPDEITSKVFEFMEQSGVRIDKKILQRCRAISLNFPEKEKAAAEIACMLIEKGIEPTEENVRKILLYLDFVYANTSENNLIYENDNENKKNESKEEAKNFLEELYSILPCKKSGILAFINHYKTLNVAKHWLVLPYEWQLNNKSANGFIKLLLNTDIKSIEKIQISCKIACKKYFFVLYYDNSKVKEVRFCSLPPLLASEVKNEERRLGELFCSGMNANSVPVTYSNLAYSEGLYSSSEVSFSFEHRA